MTYRLLCCISGVLTVSAFPDQSAAEHEFADAGLVIKQADLLSGRPLMRLEKGSYASAELRTQLSDTEANRAEVAGLDPLNRVRHNKSSQSSSHALELAELRQIREHHVKSEDPTPSFPGMVTEVNVSDIVGELVMECKDAQKIFLKVEALSTVQKEIAKVAEVPDDSVTGAFSSPAALMETSVGGGSASRTSDLHLEFSIGVPNGTDPDIIRKKINDVNKNDLATNLGNEFLTLEVVEAAEDITVKTIRAKEQDNTVTGPQAGAWSLRTQLPLHPLLAVFLVVMSATTHSMT